MRVILLALFFAACTPVSGDIVKSLSESNRTWCLSVTSVYANIRMGGTGAENAAVICNTEGLKQEGGNGGIQMVPTKMRLAPAN